MAQRSRGVVLVVDDEADIRDIVAFSLEGEGFEVVQAANGSEALDVLRSQPAIALLFTDVVMPGPLDGFSLAHEAKKMRPDLRVVYASGYIKNLPWGEHGIGHGRILSKPFRPIQVLQ